jgi:hypothetical protein
MKNMSIADDVRAAVDSMASSPHHSVYEGLHDRDEETRIEELFDDLEDSLVDINGAVHMSLLTRQKLKPSAEPVDDYATLPNISVISEVKRSLGDLGSSSVSLQNTLDALALRDLFDYPEDAFMEVDDKVSEGLTCAVPVGQLINDTVSSISLTMYRVFSTGRNAVDESRRSRLNDEFSISEDAFIILNHGLRAATLSRVYIDEEFGYEGSDYDDDDWFLDPDEFDV